jgi:hypothetical protein
MQSPHGSGGLSGRISLPDKAGSEASPEATGRGDSAQRNSGRKTPGSNREAGNPSPASREAAKQFLETALRSDLPVIGWKGATDEGEVRKILLRNFGRRGGLKLLLERGPEWFRELAFKRWRGERTADHRPTASFI